MNSKKNEVEVNEIYELMESSIIFEDEKNISINLHVLLKSYEMAQKNETFVSWHDEMVSIFLEVFFGRVEKIISRYGYTFDEKQQAAHTFNFILNNFLLYDAVVFPLIKDGKFTL